MNLINYSRRTTISDFLVTHAVDCQGRYLISIHMNYYLHYFFPQIAVWIPLASTVKLLRFLQLKHPLHPLFNEEILYQSFKEKLFTKVLLCTQLRNTCWCWLQRVSNIEDCDVTATVTTQTHRISPYIFDYLTHLTKIKKKKL